MFVIDDHDLETLASLLNYCMHYSFLKKNLLQGQLVTGNIPRR